MTAQEVQALGPGVQVDWASMLVTSVDGRHGTVIDVMMSADPNEVRSSLHVLVQWSDQSRTMFTTGTRRSAQDCGPADKRRLH